MLIKAYNNARMLSSGSQWISEVFHFCHGLPIILVGCKKDLRHDPKTLEELHKTSQKPVTDQQVCCHITLKVRLQILIDVVLG